MDTAADEQQHAVVVRSSLLKRSSESQWSLPAASMNGLCWLLKGDRPAGYSHFYLLDTAIQELRVQCVADIFSSFFFAGGSRPFLVERPLKASNFQPPHHSHSRAYSMHLCLAVAREFQKWNCIVPGISSPRFLNNFPTDHSEADLGVTIRSSNAETVDILLSPSLFLMRFNNCIVLFIILLNKAVLPQD